MIGAYMEPRRAHWKTAIAIGAVFGLEYEIDDVFMCVDSYR